MARPRAADHDLKRRAILDRCARLFAERGYARTSMSEIASACGSSKALLYHYYENKEQLLYDLLEAHFIKLEEAVKAADAPSAPPVERLRGLIAALLAAYEGADALHKVQINELSALPVPRQQELKAYERRLVDLFASALRDINPVSGEGQSVAQAGDDVAVRHDQLVLPLVPAGRTDVACGICQPRHADYGRWHSQARDRQPNAHPFALQGDVALELDALRQPIRRRIPPEIPSNCVA